MEKILLKGNKIKEKFEVEDQLDVVMFASGGGEAEIEIVLKKEGAEAHLYGIIEGKGSDEFIIKTISHHISPNTNSRVHLKGVFDDSSKMDYEGLIKIDEKAQLSDAYLQNDNLIIGDDAVVNSSPQLEIAADDVKASHGVTISTIDELQEFYLKSRGLPSEKAEKLLVKGFVNDIVQKL